MKKIIIVNNNLNTGGVQVSLINLLKEINSLYDITLLLFSIDENCREDIPDNVKVITTKSPFKYFGISQAESKKSLFSFLGRSFWAMATKIFGRSLVTSLMSVFQTKIKGYDVAISYLHEGPQRSFYGGCNDFVLRKIEADKKLAWIHCDFGLCGANCEKSKRIYEQFDTIVACSEGSKASFVKCLPELQDKCIAIRNCNDFAMIAQKAKPAVEYDKNYFNLVTVARLSAEKGIDRMLYAVSEAKNAGHKLKYHIIGYGADELALKNLAKDLKIEDIVEFYGIQRNPYKYIASADLFVLPSHHEAAPMVFDEASSLGVPILATATTSTDEMIIEANAGFVCENSQSGLATALINILNNPQKVKAIADNLKNRTFTNQKSIDSVKVVF